MSIKHVAGRVSRKLQSLVDAGGPRRDLAENWPERIALACACPDNPRIPRHKDAGKIRDGFQVMHNGQHVCVDGYYGKGITDMLAANKGCHEPQEEVVFQEVLKRVPSNAQMLELGSYWGFYSMWFLHDRPKRMAWLVEPDLTNLDVGVRNFRQNGLVGMFTSAWIGESSRSDISPPVVCVDQLLELAGLERLSILHADVQGAEVAMLRGARQSFERRAIDFAFVSTHTSDLHRECVSILNSHEYRVDVSVFPEESFSYDGVIVAVKDRHQPELPIPSRRTLTHGS